MRYGLTEEYTSRALNIVAVLIIAIAILGGCAYSPVTHNVHLGEGAAVSVNVDTSEGKGARTATITPQEEIARESATYREIRD